MKTPIWKNFMRLQYRCFLVNYAKFLRTLPGDCCYLWKELQITYIVESLTISRGLQYDSIVKVRPWLTKFSAMIVKFNAFNVPMIFPSVLRRQLSITSFVQMSVAVHTRKSKMPFLTKFKIMKLNIDAFSNFVMFIKELY